MSYGARVARANFLAPDALVSQRAMHGWSAQPEGVTDDLAAAVEVDPGVVAALGLAQLPRGITGRGNRQRAIARTWRLPGVRWLCPSCTPTTGVWLREWELACHPLCSGCPALLVPADVPGTRVVWPTPDARAVAVQKRIAAALLRDEISGRSSTRWRRTYQLTTLIAATADRQWPRLVGWEAEIRSGLLEVYRGWPRRSPIEPAQAAVVVLEAWRATESPARGRALIGEGWERLLAHPDRAVRSLGDATGVLPARPPCHRLPTPRTAGGVGWRAADEAVRAIRRLQMASGLSTDHVAAWCIPGTEFAPSEAEWDHRRHLAIVLYLICAGSRQWVGGARAKRELHIEDLPPSPILRFLREDRGIAGADADLLVRTAHNLVDDGMTNYAQIRAHLRPHLSTQSLLRAVRDAGGSAVQTWSADVLTSWVWVDLTRGMPPMSRRVTRAAIEADRTLDPESRMSMRSTATELLQLGVVATPSGLRSAGVMSDQLPREVGRSS